MRVFGLLLVSSTLAFAQDAREIVLRSLDRDSDNLKAARDYTYIERTLNREYGDGGVKKTRVQTFDVTLVDGSPYRRLIARDDKPLPPGEQRKQQERLRQSVEERRRETPDQRARRIARWEKEREERRKPFLEIPDAYDLRVAGQETIDGRPAWTIDATPRPGFRGKTRISRLFPKIQGRLWIDQQNSTWIKAEAETLDTISFGWFLARLHPGARLRFEQTRVNSEVWLPKHVALTASARVALFMNARVDFESTYSDYRKFRTDSRVVAFDPAQ